VPEDVKPSFVAEERAKAEATGTLAAFLREWECDFDSAEGLVYPMFCDLHVAEPWADVEPTEVIIGMDHGWEDPGVILVGHVYGSGQEAVVHVVEEVYEPHRDPTWWGDKCASLKARYPRAHCYADPSRPDLIELYRKRSGLNIVPAQNARDDGLWSVQDRMALRLRHDGEKYARLKFSPRCLRTIQEIGTYRYKRDPRDKERHIDAVDDRDDHAMDALRYMVFSRFGKPAGTRSDTSDYHFG
jgi:phage terminase large subunit